MCLMDTNIHTTMTYKPTANGMVKCSDHSLKTALMACCSSTNWKSQLLWVLLGLRTAPKEGLTACPAEMIFGKTMTIPRVFFPVAPNGGPIKDLTHLRHITGTSNYAGKPTSTFSSSKPPKASIPADTFLSGKMFTGLHSHISIMVLLLSLKGGPRCTNY